jgi:hypothetical protein
VTLRLVTWQRDLFLADPAISRSLAAALKRAPVRDAKLGVRVNRDELDALILAAARHQPEGKEREREVNALLAYLEGIEDRFVEDDDSARGSD